MGRGTSFVFQGGAMCKVTPDFVEHRQPGVVAPGADWLSHLTEADILYQLIFISVLRYHTHTKYGPRSVGSICLATWPVRQAAALCAAI